VISLQNLYSKVNEKLTNYVIYKWKKVMIIIVIIECVGEYQDTHLTPLLKNSCVQLFLTMYILYNLFYL